MFIVNADTYMESYGSESTIFYIGKSKEDCERYIKEYNKKVEEFENFIKTFGIGPNKNIWELKGNDKAKVEKWRDKIVFDGFTGSNKVFKFDLNDIDYYIDEFENGKPWCVGRYTE